MLISEPPSAWSRDHLGRPEWMLLNFLKADLGPWYAVVPTNQIMNLSGQPGFMAGKPDWSAWAEPGLRAVRRDGPKAMPRFLPHHLPDPVEAADARPERRRRGPKRIEDARLKGRIAGDVAWRVDLDGHRRADVARWLDPIPKKEKNRDPTSASIEKAARYLNAGRRMLWREGVLPWGVWPNGGFAVSSNTASLGHRALHP